MVLLMQNEATKLIENGNTVFPEDVRARINARLLWAKVACEDSWDVSYTESGGKRGMEHRSSSKQNSNIIISSIFVSTLLLTTGLVLQRFR